MEFGKEGVLNPSVSPLARGEVLIFFCEFGPAASLGDAGIESRIDGTHNPSVSPLAQGRSIFF